MQWCGFRLMLMLFRVMKEYVKSPNKEFATAAIEAIGRCAIGMPEMAESCLNGLMKLLWSKNGRTQNAIHLTVL
jgi:hypothetical protein